MNIKKDNRDEIIIICDLLEECKKRQICNYNPIVCAKSVLKEYIGNDYNILLKYKAQVEYNYNFEENVMSSIALIISAISLIISAIIGVADVASSYLSQETNKLISINVIEIIAVLMIIVLIVFIIPRIYNRLMWKRKRWLTYIKYALEDIEKDFEHKKTGL